MSYEKPCDLADQTKIQSVQVQLAEHDIEWLRMKYHKRPSLLATAYDIFCGVRRGSKAIRTNDIQVIHARSYVASMMALLLNKKTSVPWVFDMRGFWADEKIDSKTWSKGFLYNLVKKLELRFLKKSAHIISLTQSAVDEILSWQSCVDLKQDKFSVIPTCVNLDLFKLKRKPPSSSLRIAYVGNAISWYDFDKALIAFKKLQSVYPSFLTIVNQGQHDYIIERIKANEISEKSYSLKTAEHGEITQIMQEQDWGLFFIKNFYSKKASMPTKLGEFLASGVPVITGPDIGDVDAIIKNENVGLILSEDIENVDLSVILDYQKDLELQKRSRATAEKYFSLDVAVSKINDIYMKIT